MNTTRFLKHGHFSTLCMKQLTSLMCSGFKVETPSQVILRSVTLYLKDSFKNGHSEIVFCKIAQSKLLKSFL